MKNLATTSLMHAMAAMILTLSACNGQAQDQNVDTGPDSLSVQPNMPKTEVQVNKEYDEHGNLIAFDSTYSSFYSTHATDPALIDSLFRDLRPRFNSRFPFMTDPGFNDLFFRDSLLYPDFFHDDFFRKRMEMNDRWMDQVMMEMDSMKNAYFRERTAKPPNGNGAPQ